MSKTTDRQKELYREIMVALYNNSTPKFDWAALIDRGCVEELKSFDFNNYYLDSKKFDEIVEGVLKRSRLSKYHKQQIRVSVYLGPSPTSYKG